ncbi:MAG: hypothetical protein WB421_05440 [Terriglobales bacterium]
MNRFITIILFMFGMASILLNAQSSPTFKCASGNLSEEKPATADAIKTFWEKLESALEKNDKRSLSKMAHYPLSVFSANKFSVQSETDFIKDFDRIFPKNLREMLIRQRSECISRVGAQGFSVGSGQIWFDQYPDGKVRFFSVNAVVYAGE